MTNKDVERIVRRQCIECGTEYDDSVNQALEGGEVPPADASIEAKALYGSVVRKTGNGIQYKGE